MDVKYNRKKLFIAILIIFGTVALLNTRPEPMFFYNSSASIPLGVYYKIEYDGKLQTGDIVVFTPPEKAKKIAYERGYISEGTPMMKYVVAVEGDEFLIDGSDFFAAEKYYGHVAAEDSAGRELYPYSNHMFTVNKGEFIAAGTHPRSFDSRYWGPVSENNILAKAVPIFTYESEE